MSAEDKPGGSLFGQPRAVVEAALPAREPVRCPLCDIDPEPFATDAQGFRLARCPRCGLEFQSPRPVFAELAARVYGRDYHAAEEVGPPDITGTAYFARQLAHLKRLLRRRGSLLDVGCGAGFFLEYARNNGWDVAGTEIRLSRRAQGLGVLLREGQLGEIDFGGRQFDVVRFHHVLEHTENPLIELQHARKLLLPAGVLLVAVPNLAGLSPRLKSWQSRLGLKGNRWRHYAALHHLWYFTPPTLTRLVEAAGFKTAFWETPVPAKASQSRRRRGQPAWVTTLLRAVLEPLRWGSLLDFYCRPS